MLYRFKSDAGGDVLMLQAHGRQILDIWGKDAQASGILLPQQMAAAMAALQSAMEQDEQAAAGDQAEQDDARRRVNLRTRAWPLLMLMERSAKQEVPITWGV